MVFGEVKDARMIGRFVTVLAIGICWCASNWCVVPTWAQTLVPAATSGSPAVEPVQFAGETKVVPLPGLLHQTVVGGAGRYLLIHIPVLKKIAVFDISQAKITGYVPAEEDGTLLAATKDKLLVVNPVQNTITKWNLADLTKELTVAVPFAGVLQEIVAGSAGNGPVLVSWSPNKEPLAPVAFAFLDLASLGELKTNWTGEDCSPRYRDQVRLRAASNGKFFTISRCGAVMIEGSQVTSAIDYLSRNHMIPSADGQYYGEGGEIVGFKGKPIWGDEENSSSPFKGIAPAVTENFYLNFPFDDDSNSGKPMVGAKLYMFGERRPLMSIPQLTMELPVERRSAYEVLFPSERVTFVPEAKVVVIASKSNDALIMTRFDLFPALEASGIDYLLVTSKPTQSTVRPGERFEYKLQVKSKLGGLAYSVETGPAGLNVSTDGTVAWDVPTTWDQAANKVILSVKDSGGQEVFQPFEINVEIKPKSDPPSPPTNTGNPAIDTMRPLPSAREVPRKAAENASGFAQRIWTDSTGNHKIEATFSKIVDRKLVILKYSNGSEKQIPLNRLSPEDMYHAIECDLKRLQRR